MDPTTFDILRFLLNRVYYLFWSKNWAVFYNSKAKNDDNALDDSGDSGDTGSATADE